MLGTGGAWKKKVGWYTKYGIIEILEQILWSKSTGLIRPFLQYAKVYCNSYSLPLQRVITDFAGSCSFAETVKKIKEHYGIDLPISAVRKIAEEHGNKIREFNETSIPKIERSPKCIIEESDGSMVPIAEIQNGKKQCLWREMYVTFAREQGSIKAHYAVTADGIEAAGDQMELCAEHFGITELTHVHFVSDGAKCIAEEVDKRFGIQAYFLVDFYHLSEHLGLAAKCVQPDDPKKWRRENQELMKTDQVSSVLNNLKQHPECGKDCEARKCYGYINDRPNQFRYKETLEKRLPIGSGEVESAHRNLIQARIKKPGAWWDRKNAVKIANIKVIQINDYWDDYWLNEKKLSRA